MRLITSIRKPAAGAVEALSDLQARSKRNDIDLSRQIAHPAYGRVAAAARKPRSRTREREAGSLRAATGPVFIDLLRRKQPPGYVAFDIFWLYGAGLRPLLLAERRRQLQAILPAGSPMITEAMSVERRGCELFQLMRAHDLEGIVAKRLADPYGPRVRWLKIKNPDYSQAEGLGRVVQPGARIG